MIMMVKKILTRKIMLWEIKNFILLGMLLNIALLYDAGLYVNKWLFLSLLTTLLIGNVNIRIGKFAWNPNPIIPPV